MKLFASLLVLAVLCTMTVAATVSFGPIGCYWGTPFTDYAVGTQNKLTGVAVVVCLGGSSSPPTNYIGQLQAVYGSTTVTHGKGCVCQGCTGVTYSATLGANDYFMNVTAWTLEVLGSASLLTALRFSTNNTVTGVITNYGPWGTLQPRNFTAPAPNGYALAYFAGHDATPYHGIELEFFFTPMAIPFGPIGPSSGVAFDDSAFATQTLAGVTVHTDTSGAITGFEMVYRNGSAVFHGVRSVNSQSLVLAPGVFITEVYAGVGQQLNYLFFSTSLDYPIAFGQLGETDTYLGYNAPRNVGLVYVSGRFSGPRGVVTQLTFHFATM